MIEELAVIPEFIQPLLWFSVTTYQSQYTGHCYSDHRINLWIMVFFIYIILDPYGKI